MQSMETRVLLVSSHSSLDQALEYSWHFSVLSYKKLEMAYNCQNFHFFILHDLYLHCSLNNINFIVVFTQFSTFLSSSPPLFFFFLGPLPFEMFPRYSQIVANWILVVVHTFLIPVFSIKKIILKNLANKTKLNCCYKKNYVVQRLWFDFG